MQLAALVNNRRNIARVTGERYRIKKIGRMQHPIAQEQEYARYLKSIVEFTARQIREKLFPRLPYLLRSAAIVRGDSYTDDINEIVRTIRATVGEQFSDEQIRHAVRARGLVIADWNRKQMTRLLTGALSVDVYFTEPYLKPELDGFVNQNVGLIQTIPQTHLKNVEQTVTQGIRNGMRVGDLEKMIEAKYHPAMNHAELIARDQVGKFNGNLNQLRQKELGIRKYRWRTVRDERVRPFHEELEGTIQSWDEPPVVSRDGRREHPGGDYQCRCQAEPILDF